MRSHAPAATLKVLLVDNDSGSRQVTAELLRDCGNQVRYFLFLSAPNAMHVEAPQVPRLTSPKRLSNAMARTDQQRLPSPQPQPASVAAAHTRRCPHTQVKAVRTTAEALQALSSSDGQGFELILKAHEPGPGESNAFRLLSKIGRSQHFRTTPVVGEWRAAVVRRPSYLTRYLRLTCSHVHRCPSSSAAVPVRFARLLRPITAGHPPHPPTPRPPLNSSSRYQPTTPKLNTLPPSAIRTIFKSPVGFCSGVQQG